ncbi:hypothetical protein BGC30_15055 [Novacetimonas hansenii]|nr:hypothetical protein BGC30_15055 [Novacetimonas hansenii]
MVGLCAQQLRRMLKDVASFGEIGACPWGIGDLCVRDSMFKLVGAQGGKSCDQFVDIGVYRFVSHGVPPLIKGSEHPSARHRRGYGNRMTPVAELACPYPTYGAAKGSVGEVFYRAMAGAPF